MVWGVFYLCLNDPFARNPECICGWSHVYLKEVVGKSDDEVSAKRNLVPRIGDTPIFLSFSTAYLSQDFPFWKELTGMLAKLFRTVSRDYLRAFETPAKYKPLQRGVVSHFCTRNKDDQSDDTDSKKGPSAEESSAASLDDHEIFEAFDKELNIDDDIERKGTPKEKMRFESVDANASKDEPRKPWSRKERVKACLAKLKKGPDGRYINVFEVITDIDMLLASYVDLRAKENPLVGNSDDDEKYLEGVDMEKFKRLQKRLREGTYKFQPVVQVPLPKPKVVKRKKKK